MFGTFYYFRGYTSVPRKQALTLEASQLRISRIARQTYAGRIMIDDVALGIGPAIARIDTRAVDTRIVSCAFTV